MALHIAATALVVVEFTLIQAVAFGITTIIYLLAPEPGADTQPGFTIWLRIFQIVGPTITLSGGAGIVFSSIIYARQAQQAERRARAAESEAARQAAQAAQIQAQAQVEVARANERAAQAQVEAARANERAAQAQVEAARANERAAVVEAERLRTRLAELESGNANGRTAP